MNMNPEIKAKWVAALRSGEYRKGMGQLRAVAKTAEARDAFCCLGVLCEIIGAKYVFGDDYLPHDIPETAAIPISVQKTLARLNDGIVGAGRAWSFREIAGYIEANL